ncbi:hypothetical protein [Rheinheimera aquimaris]|uniref:hypothetical protein n=1 Tax=Rheinheimera aquimaris TaxID=412437 RepID=UPI003A981815
MKADYAKRKLTSLLADDLRCYTDGEFARQMMRIIDGATEFDVEKMIDQNASIAMSMVALKKQVAEQLKVIEHIASAVGEEADPMACWEAVDALKAQLKEKDAAIDRLVSGYSRSRLELSELFAQVENILNGDLTPEQYHQISNSGFAAEIKAQAIRSFVSDTNEAGQLSWSDAQWLEDWRDEWLSQSAKAGS